MHKDVHCMSLLLEKFSTVLHCLCPLDVQVITPSPGLFTFFQKVRCMHTPLLTVLCRLTWNNTETVKYPGEHGVKLTKKKALRCYKLGDRHL